MEPKFFNLIIVDEIFLLLLNNSHKFTYIFGSFVFLKHSKLFHWIAFFSKEE